MNCRRFFIDDYEEICGWWVAHGWDAVPLEFLPMGFLVEKDGKKKCAGFLYRDVSAPFAMLEWVVSNPENKGTESYRAIDRLLGEMVRFCEDNAIRAIYSKLVNKGLEKLYNKHGFASGEPVKDMVRI